VVDTSAGDPAVSVSLMAPMGPLLANPDGFTLYRIISGPDGNPADCVAEDGCDDIWVPFTVVGAPVSSPDVKGSLSTRPLADGTLQLLFNGWPLYVYTEDGDPGDVLGDQVTDDFGSWAAITIN